MGHWRWGWWSWLRRQWLLAALLVVLLYLDGQAGRPTPEGAWPAGDTYADSGMWWTVAGPLAMCVLALVSSRWPIGASVAACAVQLGFGAMVALSGVQARGLAGPLLSAELCAVAVITVAVVRRVPARAAAGVVALLVGCSLGAAALRSPANYYSAIPPLAGILLIVCVAVGWYLRRGDSEHAKLTRAAVTKARQRERVRMARELHDVVAHHVGVMVVQAQAARAVAATRPETAAEVLPAIETAGTDALAAMRRLVAALRDADQDDAKRDGPLERTTDLTGDLRVVTATPPSGGVPVRLDVALDEPVPAEVSASVLRLVQESVTNARRHAYAASEIAVSVRTGDGAVRVQVRDDGHTVGGSTANRGGFGLIGMRERVQLLAGRFAAGPDPAGGWRVSAEVPLRGTGR